MNIASWVNSGTVQITLRDLIELEHEYPGLLKDVDTCIWQVMLIKQQIESKSHAR